MSRENDNRPTIDRTGLPPHFKVDLDVFEDGIFHACIGDDDIDILFTASMGIKNDGTAKACKLANATVDYRAAQALAEAYNEYPTALKRIAELEEALRAAQDEATLAHADEQQWKREAAKFQSRAEQAEQRLAWARHDLENPIRSCIAGLNDGYKKLQKILETDPRKAGE
jgi:hypothetical protein